ncbi:hypothetical protein FJZ41_03705, partial [Candidatus Shapirobacteria bacterium]|nr:hypothetical protein [Candidatus Shapirobacteria bacterium]
MPWMKKNLKFSQMTATRYIAVFNDSRRLDGKSNTMLDLTKVYQSLIEHKPKPKQKPRASGDIGHFKKL